MTTFAFHTTVLDNGMLAVPLPEEFRGTPVKIIVEEEATVFLEIPNRKMGILSIAGILKDCRNGDTQDERYEYLMDKYANNKNTD
jgi:hypothetical protein